MIATRCGRQPALRPHAEAHCAHCRREQAMPQPQTRSPKAAAVDVLPRSSVVRLAICGSAAASATAPEAPIWLSASRATLTAPPTLPPAAHNPTVRPHAEAHCAHYRLKRAMPQAPKPKPQSRSRGRTAKIERREARHLRQRRRQRRRALGSDLVVCEPRNPHRPSSPTARSPQPDRAPARRGTLCPLPP
jgi:hypothetical protein